MKFKSKVIEIEAVQWTGDNTAEIQAFTENGFNATDLETSHKPTPIATWGEVYDYLHETWVGVKPGQWIIKGTKGEFYPCDNEVFEEKYEPANELGLYEPKDLIK